MSVGLASAIAADLLDALFNATAYTGPAAIYAQLHIGDPGAAGTSNPASNTTRQAVTLGAASGGAISNDSAPSWTSVPAAEDYTHVSLWDASTAGNFLFSGTITANSVAIGDTFTVAVGDMDITLTVAA